MVLPLIGHSIGSAKKERKRFRVHCFNKYKCIDGFKIMSPNYSIKLDGLCLLTNNKYCILNQFHKNITEDLICHLVAWLICLYRCFAFSLEGTNALCCIWPHIGLLFFLVDTFQIWVWDLNLCNKLNDLPYSDLGCIHEDTGNRPLKLGQFLTFREFSLFTG